MARTVYVDQYCFDQGAFILQEMDQVYDEGRDPQETLFAELYNSIVFAISRELGRDSCYYISLSCIGKQEHFLVRFGSEDIGKFLKNDDQMKKIPFSFTISRYMSKVKLG